MTTNPDFDLDWPHGHQTRAGQKARILARDLSSPHYPLAVVIAYLENEGYEKLEKYTLDGRYYHNYQAEQSPLDLVNTPKPKKQIQAWANAYLKREDKILTIYCYPTRELADKNASKSRVACLLIDFTEGDGL